MLSPGVSRSRASSRNQAQKARAPLVDLELRQPSAASDRDLESGGLDLLVVPRQDSGPGIVWSTLFRDRYVGIAVARAELETVYALPL
jgi:hypothetical protein